MDEIYSRIIKEVAERRSKGFHIDDRIVKTIELPDRSPVSQVSLKSKDDFLRLQYHDNDASWIFIPSGFPRTLKDCVEGMLDKKLTPQKLAHDFGPPEAHRAWFADKLSIYTNFDYNSFYSLFLLNFSGADRRTSAEANYIIFDGQHRSLFLAYKLMEEHVEFSPINAYLFSDRDRVEHQPPRSAIPSASNFNANAIT